jgi:hypothetical protein
MIKIELPKETRVVARSVKISQGNSVFRIRQISDTHQEADGFNEQLFKRFVDIQRRDKDSVWIHTGDVTDSDRPSTRQMKKIMFSDRKEAYSIEDKKNLDFLDRHIIPQYKNIAESCLGILDGDHYEVYSNGLTSGKYIAHKLRVPYLGERSSYVAINFHATDTLYGDLSYIIHARHGRSGGGTTGGSVNALVKGDVGYLADLHLGGHNHQEHCHPVRLEYVSQQGIIKHKIIWYVRGGSFLDGFPANGRKTYAYRKEYNPLPTGWGEVELTIGRSYIGQSPKTGNSLYAPYGVKMSKASIVAV